MRTNREATEKILAKARKTRNKKRIITAISSLAIVGVLIFIVAFSNIIPMDFSLYGNSYKNYMRPYATPNARIQKVNAGTEDNSEVALRIVDDKNAVVCVDGEVYPCYLEAESNDEFTLTPTNSDMSGDGDSAEEEKPSVFRVEFWKNNATVSWSLYGVEIEKVLSVTNEFGVPAGLWVTCYSQFQNGPLSTISAAGWTLIQEDGYTYMGEGVDPYIAQFVSVNDILFKCIFDSKSGLILDATLVEYNTTLFDYPVLKEHYVSDGDEIYHYSRRITDSERLHFTGGTFQAAGVTYECDDMKISRKELAHESMAKWQLLPKKSAELKLLDVKANLILSNDGSAKLSVTGDKDFADKVSGKWYALHHSVLVVLDKNTELTGRLFSLYVDDTSILTQESMESHAFSQLFRYDYYKVGYHVFEYHAVEESVEIFWGSEWDLPEYLTTGLVYEQPYVLNATYIPSYYKESGSTSDQPTPFIANGKLELIFHTNGTVTICDLIAGTEKTRRFRGGDEGDSTIDVDYDIACYMFYTENGPRGVAPTRYEIGNGYIYAERQGYSIRFDVKPK